MSNMNEEHPHANENPVDVNMWIPLMRGISLILLGVGGFLVWSMLAPLDAGVVAEGTVTVSSNRKTIQHLTGGRVIDIVVKEGQQIKKNQPLLLLDKTQIEMRYSALTAQYLVAKSIEDRLLSERDGLPEVMFSEELIAGYGNNPRLNEVLELQKKLFATRIQAVNGELAMLDESVTGLNKQIDSLIKIKLSRQRQLTLINQEYAAVKALHDKKFYPKAQMLSLERDVSELTGKLSEDILNIARLTSQSNELKLKRHQYQHEYIKEVESELTHQQKEVATLEDELISAKHDLDNTIIISPIDGIVLDIQVNTVGGVIQPGEHLMDIVSSKHPLQIDAMIPVQAIDKLVPGLTVDILFPALNHALLPSIPGKVLTISADRLIDKTTQQPYYLAEIQVTPAGVSLLGDYQIKAGMPASVTVKTGERTLMNYLLKPFLARLELALKET